TAGAGPGGDPGAGTRSKPTVLLRRACQRQIDLTARDGTVARAPLFRSLAPRDAVDRFLPHPTGPGHRTRRRGRDMMVWTTTMRGLPGASSLRSSAGSSRTVLAVTG